MKKRLNKKEKAWVYLYNKSNYWGIYQCYASYSHNKRRAEYSIRLEKKEMNGYEYKIISFNSQCFTCGYKYKKNDKEFLRVHTKSTYYDIDLSLSC